MHPGNHSLQSYGTSQTIHGFSSVIYKVGILISYREILALAVFTRDCYPIFSSWAANRLIMIYLVIIFWHSTHSCAYDP